MALLHSFISKKVTDTTSTTNSTDERTSRAKKSKLMKVCLDRTKSVLKESIEKKHCRKKKNHVTLTYNDGSSSDSSTFNNENSILTDDEFNMKIPLVVRKKSSLTTNVRDMVKIDVPEDSDGSGSTSLL